MKSKLIDILKVAVPLGIGVWLVFYFYNALAPAQRDQLFTAFRQANLWWLLLASFVGWLAHASRAWRWRYLLEPLGYQPGFWNCYHAVMNGYFMNMFIQRAGEASRAVSLYRTDKVPFEKGFGTILAERVVDTAMLGLLGVITILFQLDKIDLFKARIAAYRATQDPAQASGFPWFTIILLALAAITLVGAYLIFTRPNLRARFMDLMRGFGEGLRAVLSTKRKGAFLAHTLFIWVAYLGMFKLGFYCLPTLGDVPFAGILAGFIAGAIGIVLVQGGIGVYPALVALTVGMYLPASAGGELLRPDALAMGWLLWLAQTLMIIVLGGLSLLLTALKRTQT